VDEQSDHVHAAVSEEDAPDDHADPTTTEHTSDAHPAAEVAAIPAGSSVPLRVAVGIGLLVLGALQGVGSYYSWLVYSVSGQVTPLKGLDNWRGFGWMTLLLAIAIVVVIVTDLVAPSVALKAVTAALFGASGVVAIYFAVQFVGFPQAGQYPTSLGWGLDLCMGASVAGFGLGVVSARLASRSSGHSS
jgi:hypothetical protein